MTDTMKAVRFTDYGSPETLIVDKVDRPEPKSGQLLVRVQATAVHPFDTKLRSGMFKDFMPVSLPHTPGIDFAGTVEAVGEGVSEFTVGQEVFGQASGAYAEYALASADAVAVKPASLTFEQAATLPVGAGTAWSEVVTAADVRKGQTVLVHGGAGGVGMFAVQLADWKGATVIATTSTKNVEFVRSLGADIVIDYTTMRFEDAVHDVDVVIDTVGGDTLERSYGVVRRGGILVTIAGQPSAEKADELGIRAVSIQNSAKGEALRTFAQLIESGDLKVEVAKVFPLDEAGEAHALSETGHGRGRIVLRVGD